MDYEPRDEDLEEDLSEVEDACARLEARYPSNARKAAQLIADLEKSS